MQKFGYDFFNFFQKKYGSVRLISTVILSNFRSTRTVPKPYRTKLKLFIKNSLGKFDVPYYRTIIKILELFLKTRIFLKKTIKYLKIRIILWYFFQKNPSF
jgi:hypothetical protein